MGLFSGKNNCFQPPDISCCNLKTISSRKRVYLAKTCFEYKLNKDLAVGEHTAKHVTKSTKCQFINRFQEKSLETILE